MCSSAPDTSGLNAAAVMQSGIAQDALNFYKQQYADQAPLRDAAATRASAVSDAQLAAMDTATQQAQQYGKYNQEVFQPLERDIVSKAENYDTEGNRERLAGLALTDVNNQGAAARGQEIRAMEARGVNPADGAYGAGATQRQNALTLAGANAENQARAQATTMGHAMELDAASMGRNLPSAQATQAGIATTAGNSAAATGQVPVSLAQSGVAMMGQGYGTALQGNQSAGNLYGQIANIQNTANQQDNSVFSALGNVGGAAIFKYSDKNQKTNIKPIKGEIALAAARKMPAKSWQYKPTSPAADGGQTHVGPMAQDVHAALGNAAAPGAKMVNRDSVADVTLAAVQALDKKVTRLEKRKA